MRFGQAFKRYAFNSSWMLAEQLLRILSGVFVGIYVARYLGPENFGVLSYSLALSAFSIAVSRLGMDAILVREIIGNELKAKVVIGTAFWLMIAAATICYIFASFFVWSYEVGANEKIYISILLASPFFTSFLVIDYFFQSRVEAKYSTICKAIVLMVMSIVKISLVLINAELSWFVLAFLLDHVLLAIFLLNMYIFRKGPMFFGVFDVSAAKSMLKSSWPMVLSAIAVLLYMRIDQVMIRNMLGIEEVGIYSAAVKIYESWMMLPYVISISLLPLMAKLKMGDEELYIKRMTQIFRFLIWLSVLAALVAFLTGDQLVVMAFGNAYQESGGVVSIVMWAAVFAAMGAVSARYFNVEHMEKKIAVRTAVAAVINIALNFLLIPVYGIHGAAIATLACTFFSNYAMDWFDSDLRTLLRIKHRAMFFFS